MKKLLYLILFVSIANPIFSQCNIKTNNRPDGNTIKYFNPQPIIAKADYETGVAIYKNITSNELFLSVTILFKSRRVSELSGNLIIQTTNSQGISLKQATSKTIRMNGRDVAIGMYKITQLDYLQLKKYGLKNLFFNLDDVQLGSTIYKNNSILINQLMCLINKGLIKNKGTNYIIDKHSGLEIPIDPPKKNVTVIPGVTTDDLRTKGARILYDDKLQSPEAQFERSMPDYKMDGTESKYGYTDLKELSRQRELDGTEKGFLIISGSLLFIILIWVLIESIK